MIILAQEIRSIRDEFEDIPYSPDRRRTRLWCAAEAGACNRIHSRGGIMAVHKAANISRPAIYTALKEIESEDRLDNKRIGKSGGGRGKITEKNPELLKSPENPIEPLTGGDPESPLRRTCGSTYALRDGLVSQGYGISQRKICDLLSDSGCSLRSGRKSEEGGDHPGRNARFEYISGKIISFQRPGLPAVSVDTGKKENTGNYADKGGKYCKKGTPEKVKVYDFTDKKIGKSRSLRRL